MAEKYVVFKVEDWEEFRLKLVEQLPIPSDPTGHPYWGLMTKAIPDAVVIRRQDVFAPPALAAYANGIQVAVATIETSADIMQIHGTGEDDVLDRLLKVADYFHEQSEMAYHENRKKLPD